jgi:hypothetical protein
MRFESNRDRRVETFERRHTHMGRFGAFGILFILVFALIVGGIGYSLGVAAGPAATTASGTVVYPVGFWHPFGFGLFGILFFFLLIGLLIAAFRPRRWSGGPGGWGHRAWGPGPWSSGPSGSGWGPGTGGGPNDVPPGIQSMLEAWHRQAHASGGGTTGPGGSTESAGSTGAGGPTTTF